MWLIFPIFSWFFGNHLKLIFLCFSNWFNFLRRFNLDNNMKPWSYLNLFLLTKKPRNTPSVIPRQLGQSNSFGFSQVLHTFSTSQEKITPQFSALDIQTNVHCEFFRFFIFLIFPVLILFIFAAVGSIPSQKKPQG